MMAAPHAPRMPIDLSSPRLSRGEDTAYAQYIQARAQAAQAFAATHRVQPLWRALTAATDALLQVTVSGQPITVIAVGGYGRRELFLYSDVDVLILTPDTVNAAQEAAIVRVLQTLWDQQVPISHATRTCAQTVALAAHDATVSTALMDARHIAGDRAPYLALKRVLRTEVFGSNPHAYVRAKLQERDVRHARYGDSRFMLEPNVKDGKGGLRDLQALNWLARYCYGTTHVQNMLREDMLSASEWSNFRQAYLFFSTVRAQLQALRGRADDRLSFDVQPAVAKALGFTGKTPQARAQGLMMRYFHYARTVGNMTRMLCATLEQQQMRGSSSPFGWDHVQLLLPAYLTMDHGRLNFSAQADLMAAPQQAIGLFAQAQEHRCDIHPRAQLMLSRSLPQMGHHLPLDGESNRLFLSILLSAHAPEASLRRMNEIGVLAAIIPEFGRLCGQMQYDGYHTYTVDEHILIAIGNLRQLETGQCSDELPLSTALARDARDRAVLYVAMLCHDIAKGTGGAHADKGARMSAIVATRLGLQHDEAALVEWLVRHHALLSDTAFKRDLDDPQTLIDFVAVVQSPQRLRLLVLITVADIRAVGPTVFNGWKGALMRTLYHRAMAHMGVGSSVADALESHRSLVAQWHAQPQTIAVAITHDPFLAATAIAICCSSAPRLFTVLTGALTALGCSIVSARIRALPQAQEASLAEFHVQNNHGESFADDDKRLQQLPALIQQALRDASVLDHKLSARRVVSRTTDRHVRCGVFIDNQVSSAASVIEVNARDRVGLLYAVLQAMDDCQLHVMNAHIATYGQLAVDVFYVKDAYGHKLAHAARLAQVQKALLAAVTIPTQGC